MNTVTYKILKLLNGEELICELADNNPSIKNAS